mgnify:CR=1 FL=1
MIPEEANYQRTMKRDVEPYLRNCEKDGYIESYDSTAIYYRTYRIPQAKAAIVISHGFCEFAEKYKEVIYYFLKNGVMAVDALVPGGYRVGADGKWVQN